MIRITLIGCLLVLVSCTEQSDWSWGSKTKESGLESAQQGATSAIFGTVLNGTEAESVVDKIIASGREGRALGEDAFQQVVSEPALKRALEDGDDNQARLIVKERLCNLGLMTCDGFEGKHPHLGVDPQEVFYAQPVALKPVGHPIPAVPARQPHAYKPFSGPSGYPRPAYPRPPIARPPPIGPAGIYGPPKPLPHYELEQYGGPQKHPLVGPIGPGLKDNGAVTHVHHHYHHANGPVGGGGLYPGFAKDIPAGSAGFSKLPPAPVYEPDIEIDETGGHYGSSFYKKELSLNKKQSAAGNTLNPSYASQYQLYDQQRGDNCYCVPVDQCAPHEVIGRKEDNTGYLIDPRHQDSDIEAEVTTQQSEQIELAAITESPANDNNATESNSSRRKRQTSSSTTSSSSSAQADAGSRVGRNGKDSPEAIAEMDGLLRESQQSDTEEQRLTQTSRGFDEDALPSEPQLRLYHGSGDRPKVQPTFGVSFGLPYGYGHPYPLNTFGSVPSAVNPFFGSIGPGGVNLGAVNVNPLLSVQVTKDDLGEKVVKPLINLHVTPNAGLIHKFKGIIGGLLAHSHYPPPIPPPYYGRPPIPIIHRPPPPIYSRPPPPIYSRPPLHPPLHNGDFPYKEHEEYGDSPFDDDDDDEDYYDYPPGRSAKGLVANNNTNGYRSRAGIKNSLVKFPRYKRDDQQVVVERQFGNNYLGQGQGISRCGAYQVCCRRPYTTGRPQPQIAGYPQCGGRNAQGINGRIKNPVYVDGDSEFGEYPWQAAILKKDAHESVYVCGGTLIDAQHVLTAAHCVKGYNGQELRVRLGEWDVNHDVEFYPYVETDVVRLHIHPEFYAGTLINDVALLKLARPVDLQRNPHISPACLPDPRVDYTGSRCYTTGWGKDAFGDFGKYQNILKEVDVPMVSHHQCQSLLQQTRLGYEFKLHPGFVCAGGEEGKDACKGDGGGPMVCERSGSWQVVGVVSWGIGCGQYGVPGVYIKVAHYLDWIRQITRTFV